MTYPKYLLTTSDSYTCFGKVVERDVSYQLYASDDSKLNSGVITEHLFATDFNAQVAPNSSGKPNGTFDDTISIQFGYSRRYDQSFTVRGADVGLAGFANIPVFVRGFGGDYGILSIYKTATFVDINGNRGNVIKCN